MKDYKDWPALCIHIGPPRITIKHKPRTSTHCVVITQDGFDEVIMRDNFKAAETIFNKLINGTTKTGSTHGG
jgi:hypothetical protein